MFKFAASLVVAACLVGFAQPATAASFNLQEGFIDGAAGANAEYGFFGAATTSPFTPDYLESWTLLLENGTNYTGAGDDANVSDILHFSATGAEIWSAGYVGVALDGSNMTFGGDFAAVLVSALAANNKTQVVGDPIVGGTRSFDPTLLGACATPTPSARCVGLANESAAGTATLLVAFGVPGAVGGNDEVTVGPIGAAEVPEPATLTLVGIGGAVAAYRRRRKTA